MFLFFVCSTNSESSKKNYGINDKSSFIGGSKEYFMTPNKSGRSSGSRGYTIYGSKSFTNPSLFSKQDMNNNKLGKIDEEGK